MSIEIINSQNSINEGILHNVIILLFFATVQKPVGGP